MSYEQFYKLFNWLFFWRIRLSYNTLLQIFNVSISHSFWCKTSTTTYSSLFLNNRPQNAMDVESVLNSIKKSLRSSQNLSDKHLCVSLGKKCLFFGKFGVLCFLVTPVLRFASLPYYRRFWQWIQENFAFFRQFFWNILSS